MMMKDRINGCPVNLHSLADDQLNWLIEANRLQLRRVMIESALLVGERARRIIDDKAAPGVLEAAR
jgi:hypothetical protein